MDSDVDGRRRRRRHRRRCCYCCCRRRRLRVRLHRRAILYLTY